MHTISELLTEIDRLDPVEQWHLVKHVLDRLERVQTLSTAQTDYHQFLAETYGSLRDTPIERGDQDEYEVREPLT
jgi:hypothetical protein